MKKCKFCAEDIQENAIKCKHCGSSLTSQPHEGRDDKAKYHKDYRKLTFVAFILPIVGFIMGIVYFAKDGRLNKKLGEHLVASSIGFTILWAFIVLRILFRGFF